MCYSKLPPDLSSFSSHVVAKHNEKLNHEERKKEEKRTWITFVSDSKDDGFLNYSRYSNYHLSRLVKKKT